MCFFNFATYTILKLRTVQAPLALTLFFQITVELVVRLVITKTNIFYSGAGGDYFNYLFCYTVEPV